MNINVNMNHPQHDMKITGHVHNTNDDRLLRIIRDNLTLEEATLSDEDKFRLLHLRLHEKHRGHEDMHAEMILILFSVTIVTQFILMIWKKKHFKSYQVTSMLGVWIIPFIFSLRMPFWRFIFIWLIFTCVTALVMKKAIERPINPTTPRQVYKWFFLIYKLCCACGIIGYVVVFTTFLGINMIFGIKPNEWIDGGLLFIFYGIYYGVLSRDFAEVCADKMAAHIGYYKPDGMPTRTLEPSICAICGNKLLVPLDEKGIIENTYKLTCGHVFHEFCIRGWCIVGKKQICPYCKEKVDLKRMLRSPWERPHVFYGQLLDWVRLLGAWQPLVIVMVNKINNSLGLE